jgi:hypothetical protein
MQDKVVNYPCGGIPFTALAKRLPEGLKLERPFFRASKNTASIMRSLRRVLSDQIYSAANKLMALHQSDPAMITQLPVFAGRRPVLVMYQPGFALFGYALGG